jgi:hypothetical protein
MLKEEKPAQLFMKRNRLRRSTVSKVGEGYNLIPAFQFALLYSNCCNSFAQIGS